MFKKIKGLSIFAWVPELVGGYRNAIMNLDDTRQSLVNRRLTILLNERQRTETEQLGFT